MAIPQRGCTNSGSYYPLFIGRFARNNLRDWQARSSSVYNTLLLCSRSRAKYGLRLGNDRVPLNERKKKKIITHAHTIVGIMMLPYRTMLFSELYESCFFTSNYKQRYRRRRRSRMGYVTCKKKSRASCDFFQDEETMAEKLAMVWFHSSQATRRIMTRGSQNKQILRRGRFGKR